MYYLCRNRSRSTIQAVAFFEDVSFSESLILEIEKYFGEVFELYSLEWQKENEANLVDIVPRKRRREVIEIFSLEDSEGEYFLGNDENFAVGEIKTHLAEGKVRCHNPIECFRDRKAIYPVLGQWQKTIWPYQPCRPLLSPFFTGWGHFFR